MAHFFEAIPAKLRFKIFLSYHNLYKKTFQIIIFFNYTFWGPFANFGAPFNWGPGANCLFCRLPPLGGPDWQSKALNNNFTSRERLKTYLIKH